LKYVGLLRRGVLSKQVVFGTSLTVVVADHGVLPPTQGQSFFEND